MKFLTLACLGFIALIILNLHTKWSQFRSRKKIEHSCSKNSKKKIFVALIGERSPQSTVKTLHSIFENASCPLNIHIGIYSLIDQSTEDCVKLYKKEAEKRSESGLTFENQITAFQRFSADGGPYHAIQTLMEYVLKDEDYVLTISDGYEMLKNWDSFLVDALKENKYLSLIISIVNKSPCFTYLSNFEKSIPVIGKKPFYTPSNVEAKFWTRDCSFSPALFWKTLPKFSLQQLNEGTDVLITSSGISKGWKFEHFHTQSILIDFLSTKSLFRSSTFNDSKLLKSALDKKSLVELGLYKTVSKESVLGVVKNENENEIISKYGSRADYVYWLSKTNFS